MNKCLLTFVCSVYYGCCLASNPLADGRRLVFNPLAGGVNLDALTRDVKSIKAYRETLGMLDWSMENALVTVGGYNAATGASVDYESRGKDVLVEHDENERIANEEYRGHVLKPFKSAEFGLPHGLSKSSKPAKFGLSHGLGKHVQFIGKWRPLNKELVRPDALDGYGYMLRNKDLHELHIKLITQAGTSEEKHKIINVIMKYVILHSVIQNADAFTSSQYERDDGGYTGLAFFTNKIRYNSEALPRMLFVPIRRQDGRREACVCSVYPLTSDMRFVYKINPGVVVSRDSVELKLKDVPTSLLSLIRWKQDDTPPTAHAKPVTHSSTHGAEQKQYKAKYENVPNYKIRVGNNIYDVRPFGNSISNLEIIRKMALETPSQLKSVLEMILPFMSSSFEIEQTISEKCNAIAMLLAQVVDCVSCSRDADLLLQVFYSFGEISRGETRFLSDRGRSMIKWAVLALKGSGGDEQEQAVVKTFFPTQKRAQDHIIDCFAQLDAAVFPYLFDRVCRLGCTKFFVECLLAPIENGVLRLYPDIYEYLCSVGRYGQPIKALAILKSPAFKRYYREKVSKHLAKVKECKRRVDQQRKELQADAPSCARNFSILSEASLALNEYCIQMIDIVDRLETSFLTDGGNITGDVLQWMKAELLTSCVKLEGLLGSFQRVSRQIDKAVTELPKTYEGDVVYRSLQPIAACFQKASGVEGLMSLSLQIVKQQSEALNSKNQLSSDALHTAAALLTECAKKMSQSISAK